MDSAKIAYSKGKNDCCFTPRYGVLPLLEFVPKNKIIWCPFDTEESEFVKVFTENKYKVVYSHISAGQDYYSYEPKKWDIMISNPPFTAKKKIFERAISFGKPFALLMSNTWLNDSAPKILFKDINLQLLMFDKRIKFKGQEQKGITFSSSYYCLNLLPRQIEIRFLNCR